MTVRQMITMILLTLNVVMATASAVAAPSEASLIVREVNAKMAKIVAENISYEEKVGKIRKTYTAALLAHDGDSALDRSVTIQLVRSACTVFDSVDVQLYNTIYAHYYHYAWGSELEQWAYSPCELKGLATE